MLNIDVSFIGPRTVKKTMALDRYVRDNFRLYNLNGKNHSKRWWHHSMCWTLVLNKMTKMRLSIRIYISLLPDYESNTASCLKLLP